VAACDAKPRGRVRTAASELAALQRDHQHLQRELSRQQALTRAAQRAVGLTPPPVATAKPGKKARRRRVARALSVAARLREATPSAAAPPPPSSAGTDPAAG